MYIIFNLIALQVNQNLQSLSLHLSVTRYSGYAVPLEGYLNQLRN